MARMQGVNRSNFDDDEKYFISLATTESIWTITKRLAGWILIEEYPKGVFFLCQENTSQKYSIYFRYRDMQECTYMPNHGEWKSGRCYFRTIVNYRVFDEKGKQVLSQKNRRVICELDTSLPKKTGGVTDKVNLWYGLSYDDLSEEIREQILEDKLKELIQIDLKLKQKKWSDFKEVTIEVSD